MKTVKYTAFGKTKLVPLITYTNKQKDVIPNPNYTDILWVERGEDWYGLRNKCTLIVTREDFMNAPFENGTEDVEACRIFKLFS